MFNKKTMVLYCGGAPSMAPNAPTSPAAGGVGGGGGGAASAESAAPLPSAVGGASSWGSEGRGLIGGPLALIGPCEGAPRALIGSQAQQRPPFWSPAPPPPSSSGGEAEIDGCEADSDSEPEAPAMVPSPTAETEARAGGAAGAGPSAPELVQDELRRVTLAVVGRYLREAADGRAAKGGFEAAAAGAKGAFSLQGFLGRFGSSGAEAEAEAEAARALETLRRVGESILDRHQIAFQGMLRKMEIKKEEDLKSISEVATEVFRDGIINWGRIVTLISFGAFVAKHLKSINQENGINTLIEIITDVLVTDKREWLVKHDAWEGFVKFFHVEDIEGGLRNVLMAFASIAGIGASLAYMIR